MRAFAFGMDAGASDDHICDYGYLDVAAASLTTRPPQGIDVEDLRRVLVSRSGFTGELERVAERRSDVALVDLHHLYHGE